LEELADDRLRMAVRSRSRCSVGIAVAGGELPGRVAVVVPGCVWVGSLGEHLAQRGFVAQSRSAQNPAGRGLATAPPRTSWLTD